MTNFPYVQKLSNYKGQLKRLAEMGERYRRMGRTFKNKKEFLQNYGKKELNLRLNKKTFNAVINEIEIKLNEVNEI